MPPHPTAAYLIRSATWILLDNLRGGRFAEKAAGLPKTGEFLAVASGDLNGDGRPDLVWTSESHAWVALNRGDGNFRPHGPHANRGTHEAKTPYTTREDKRTDSTSFGAGIL